MEFIQRSLNMSDFDNLVRDSLFSTEWAALSALMRRPWFSRCWIIQEIALAKSATLHCGKDSVCWDDFANAVSLFASVKLSAMAESFLAAYLDLSLIPTLLISMRAFPSNNSGLAKIDTLRPSARQRRN